MLPQHMLYIYYILCCVISASRILNFVSMSYLANRSYWCEEFQRNKMLSLFCIDLAWMHGMTVLWHEMQTMKWSGFISKRNERLSIFQHSKNNWPFVLHMVQSFSNISYYSWACKSRQGFLCRLVWNLTCMELSVNLYCIVGKFSQILWFEWQSWTVFPEHFWMCDTYPHTWFSIMQKFSIWNAHFLLISKVFSLKSFQLYSKLKSTA